MSIERSENPEHWMPIISRIVWQVAYRQLGMVALYCDVNVAAQAIDMLCSQGMGSWKWLVEGRALLWEEVPIDSAIKVHMYVFGSKFRKKNTVFVRQGFWRMYFLEFGLSVFNQSLVGRILARL